MMNEYKVVYSKAALEDIRDIYEYIAFSLFAEHSAEKQVNRIRKGIGSLAVFPERHRIVDWEPWASMGMHQMFIDRYNVYYLVDLNQNMVKIIRIVYSGRDIEHIVLSEDPEETP
ncbi:MAG: type II toxin-antitoxin system RelE/ParE family toxin [Lachnospiraceae bacterium]|nr:type II toxin-antitoxin system RelE/ParE family toxin [Lachnospiraceae bacterium]